MLTDPMHMAEPVRTERRFGVTAKLTPQQRNELMMIRMNLGWPTLLDVLEMACIEQETTLINTDPADVKAVLENHKMAKAMWQMFEHMQNVVEAELRSHMESVANQPVDMSLTEEEIYQNNLLNPTLYYEDPETESNRSRDYES
jgi:hypothetical protein